ncbi:serine aminopeptidase domain-containing protein, partial [Bacillus cereus]|uniref:serine aminopeptidase domain-containing protein n=1 Tax=Bacillus cereus TaxID=1396 RepID=UPI0028484220
IFLFGNSMGGIIVIRMMQETKREDVYGIILRSPSLVVVTGPSAALQFAAKILNVVALKLQFATNLTVEMSTRNHEERDDMEND